MAVGRQLNALETSDKTVNYERCSVAFLDVVGFSTQMGADEQATFNRWTDLKNDLIVPCILAHGGEFIKALGDGVLAAFPRAEQAMSWAVEVQKKARSQGQSMTMRIALGFGDVIRDADGDLVGDCVNITSRLEQRSYSGGVIVTQDFRNELPNELEYQLRATGPLRLRNISRDIHAFHVMIDGRHFASTPRASRLPSIAVLPFETDEEKAVFSSGVVDDIIVSLGGVQELNVIAQSTVKALGEHRYIDPREIGETLGVDYIVTGTIQKSRVAMRAETKLLDALTGEVLSTDRSVFKIDELFQVQDKYVERIIALAAPEVKRAALERALRKPPGNFTAYEHMLRALDKVSSFDRAEFNEARHDLNAAIDADPYFSNPRAWLARWYTMCVGQGWSDDPVADSQLALATAKKAMRLDRRNALALASYGHVHAYTERDYDTAINYLDRAVAAGANNAIAHSLRSVTLSFLGRSTEAIEAAEKALRLSPFDEQLFQFFSFLALAHYAHGNFGDAIAWGQRSLAENPNYTNTLKIIIISKAAAGDVAGARELAARLLTMEPGFSLARYRNGRQPFKDDGRTEKLLEHFGLAGIPDQ